MFCDQASLSDEDALIVHRGERCYVVLNLYPYGSGHLMILPFRHVAAPGDLDAAERAEMWELLARALQALETALGAQGHNVGFNLGTAAGAGIEDHLHLHVVPRWRGDVNFMPVLADVRVMPQHLVRDACARSPRPGRPSIARMTLDPSVFKAYDVRGIVPDELDADGVYRIVRAYVDEFEPRSMAIGRDMRLTSPDLCEAAIQAALDAGSDVDEIGLVGTEMLYYAVCEHGYEGGLIVTASHNPKQYNGMKIVRRNALPLGGDGGIEKVRDRALAGRVPHARRRRGSAGSATCCRASPSAASRSSTSTPSRRCRSCSTAPTAWPGR